MKINGSKLELLAGQKGMTFRELSELSGVCRQQISTVKTRGTCTPATLFKLARALGCDPTDIMKEE